MGGQVFRLYEPVGGQLGLHQSHVQVLPSLQKVMYTTNAIEGLNSGFRCLNCGRTIFPNAMALTRAVYLATRELTKK